ncbi:MAG: hypothetical protein JWP29_3085 [Rhodoferax sp.]|nr:hypothetical protein [Rhodoferax sp.]
MNTADQQVHDQAKRAAAKLLMGATTFADFHIKKPLFQKRMGKGANAVLVRFDWPGVLGVFDAATGEPLALAEPGRPGVLQAGFPDPRAGG